MANPATKTPQRIVVVGCTGVGKSVLAATIAERRALAFVELDALFWLPDWQTPDPDDFRARVRDATSGEGWVVAGNYNTRLGSLIWERAELVVWLDYGLPRTMWQLWRRTWRRWRANDLLWGTNREILWRHFLTRDSLFWYLLRSRPRVRRRLLDAMTDPGWEHLRFVRLRSPGEMERWLAEGFPALERDP